jgi:hypothetical protein
MKKTAAVVAILTLAAATAFAYPGGFRGQGGGSCGGGAGFGGGAGGCGGGPCAQIQQGEPVDEAGAKAKVEEYLSANLKGFEITDAVKVDRPRGAMYRFSVKDKNDNLFLLMVNPFGQVRGPIPASQVK